MRYDVRQRAEYDKDNVLRDATEEERCETEIRGFVARRGGERRERDARTWWIKTENGTGSKLIPAWVSPRPPTPGEIYLPFRSSVHFLYSPATQLAYPRSRTATRHALIKFNNFCATRALRVLFALHPSLPLSLSLYPEPVYSSFPLVLSVYSQPTPLGLCHVINLCGGSRAHHRRAATTTEYRRFMTGTC